MSTATEVRRTADLLGWACRLDEKRNEDTFLRGQHMIVVVYRKDGSVDQAYRYIFYKLNNVQFQERTTSRNKKAKVLAWLAQLANTKAQAYAKTGS